MGTESVLRAWELLSLLANAHIEGDTGLRDRGPPALQARPSPPRRAEDRPRTALQSESARECSPASSSPPAAWCPGSGDQHTLREDGAQFQKSILVFFAGNRHVSADVLGL